MEAVATPERGPEFFADLRHAWRALQSRQGLRQRDAADLLGVSEGELLASAVGENVVRLEGDFRELLKRAGELGPCMALTRNPACVHEKIGPYENVSWDGQVGLALGEAIDLRLFFRHWRIGLAATEERAAGVLRSLQFFDEAGEAVHKVFLRPQSLLPAWQRLVDAFAAADQQPGVAVGPRSPAAGEGPDEAIDIAGFRAAWGAMTDTHEFFGLLKKFGVSRTQGLRLAGRDFAYPVPVDAARRLLYAAAAQKLPIMVFAGNRGCIQIHTGPVTNVVVRENWLNVMDPDFNLHLREDRVAAAWVVVKPTADGDVTSLELFAGDGSTIAMFFGKRKPGVPEMEDWRALVRKLFPREAAA